MAKRNRRTPRDIRRDEIADDVFEFICTYSDDNGLPPTFKEISEGCWMSRSNVQRYLDRLEQQGRITRRMGIPRSIVVLKR